MKQNRNEFDVIASKCGGCILLQILIAVIDKYTLDETQQ